MSDSRNLQTNEQKAHSLIIFNQRAMSVGGRSSRAGGERKNNKIDNDFSSRSRVKSSPGRSNVVNFIILIYRINTCWIAVTRPDCVLKSKSLGSWNLYLSDKVCVSSAVKKGREKAIKRTIVDGLNHIKNCSLYNFPLFLSLPIAKKRKRRKKASQEQENVNSRNLFLIFSW